ncbi:hypothetical protein [Algivirga pacifica]|uniref:Phosphate-selective porin O and P n=1 Tax=Algivirga pacifica TaxID=1162670 RepID=A0ABP9DB87_9BACT
MIALRLSYFSFLVSFLVTSLTTLNAQDTPNLELGGALRFNYNLSTWKDGQIDRGGDFGYDIFRVNAKAAYKGVKLNAEYRLYSEDFGGGMLKEGWVEYDFDEKNNIQIGLTQVPFGITQYNSHNWFFSINYYVGLEDDHDMGIKYTHMSKNFDFAVAFFKNAEEYRFGSFSDHSDSRYSYDLASKDLDGDGVLDFRNKEVNQLNAQFLYKRSLGRFDHKIGISLQGGGVYNLDTKDTGWHYAFAPHYEMIFERLDLIFQISHYKISPEAPEGEQENIVAMTAYGFPYFVTSNATTYTVGISYDFPIDWGPISGIQVYNDFGYMDKSFDDFSDTFMNVTGALVTAGNVYTYIDFATGQHMPWLNDDFNNSLAEGSIAGDQWQLRFNINFGYYFSSGSILSKESIRREKEKRDQE